MLAVNSELTAMVPVGKNSSAEIHCWKHQDNRLSVKYLEPPLSLPESPMQCTSQRAIYDRNSQEIVDLLADVISHRARLDVTRTLH